MKKINNLLTSTLFVLFAVLLGSSVAFAQAEPKIVVNDDNIVFLNTDGETTVTINLNNVDTDCNGVSFNFNYTGLKVKSYAFTDRVNEENFTATCKTTASQGVVCIMADSSDEPIVKGTGAIMTVTFEPAAGYPSLNVTGIKIAGVKKGNAYEQFTQANIHVDVNATITLSSVEAFDIAADEKKTLTLGVTNPLDLYGFTVEVALPEGLTLTGVKGTERLVNSKIIPKAQGDNVYRILVNSNNSTTAVAAGEGSVLVLTIVADADLADENIGDIKIYNFNASVGDPDDGSDNIAENELVIPVTNLVAANEAAALADKEKVRALYDEWANAIEEFENPAYMNSAAALEALAPYQTAFQDASEAIQAEAAKANEEGVAYEPVDLTELEALMAKLPEAMEEVKASYEAYMETVDAQHEEDVDIINDWLTAVQGIQNGDFKAFAEKNEEKIAALAKEIQDLYTEVQAAYETATEEFESYESPLTAEVQSKVTEEVMALVTAEAEAAAAIENEYNDDIESINELANALQEFNDHVADKFPGYAELAKDQIAALTKTIEDLNDKVIAAMEAVNETGTYDGLTGGEITAANEALIALVAGEQEALNALNEAFEATTQEIAELSDKLLDIIENENAPQGVKIEAETLLNAVDDMFYAADEAYENAFNGTGVYESPVNAEEIAEIAAKIAELEELSAINGIATDAQAARYFDINGREVVNPAAGKVYIKVENGKATKHINK